MNNIQEINTDPSWRNILLTICVASAAIYFFFFSHNEQNSRNSTSHASSTLDKDERQKRRERLAAIAEERRIAMLKRDAIIQDKANDTHTAAVDTVNNSIKSEHTTQKSEANVVGNEKVKGQSKETRDVSIGTEKVDDDSNNENSLQVSADEVEQVAAVASSSALVGASSKSTGGNEEMTANHIKSEEEEELKVKKSNNKGTGNNEDDESAEVGKEESRQRTQQAIAKLKASKKVKKKVIEEEESSSSPKLLTVYLILTSCPGSSRLELSIPNNISTATLLQQVSQTSRIAITDMKLIFRGRIINNDTTKTGRGKKENAVDEYGIVEGCALHVMGKPTLPVVQNVAADGGGGIVAETDPGEVDDNAADIEQPNTYEDYEWDELPAHVQEAATTLGYSPQLWDSDGDPFSEELYWEELTEAQRRAAIILGYNEQSWNDDSSQDTDGDEEMILLIDRIRRSTGEALYHRQAREGDLNGLQEAVNAGFSNILSVPDANGWTPLHEAIRAGNTEVIEYLVRDVGLDMTAETNQGRNALSLAQDFHGREGAVILLIESLLQDSEETNNPPTEE